MLAAGVTLVIDDLHELNSPEALAQLARLLTDLPPNAHAILATRHDVRLGLHQLRLVGELAEIRAADLRFSERETRELLDASGIALSAAGAALLHQRTEGWAAGLRLAVISLAGHPDPERFVAEFSGTERTVAEYLFAEMLDRQPPMARYRSLVTQRSSKRTCSPGSPTASSVTSARRTRRPNVPWPWPSPTGWFCPSR
jgi:LuxR family maltose regulon positive regulatory protein